ncbi:MAG: hypothetical protein HYT03_01565 [Candidatus Harrisonbacteria bacterium]|nr:hypothetical protein [Candidatus Harrisonbacteria bacterium]
MLRVKEDQFRKVVQPVLGEHGERALEIFRDYGQNFSHEVANVLLHALSQSKVEEILGTLEKIQEKKQIFLNDCEKILGFKS